MMKASCTWKISLVGMACLCLIAGCASDPAGSRKAASETSMVPSQEMVDVTHGPGVPFGGIGSGFSVFGKYGFVDVYFDGCQLNSGDWQIDRPPQEKPAFAFELTEGDKSLVLQETPVDWLTNAQPVDLVKAYADLPKGYFVFEKAGANLGLAVTGFSPMVPHDLANSSIPAQVFDVMVENKGDQARSFQLALRHREDLVVRNGKAVLVTDRGETAFSCEGGVADTQVVGAILKLAPGQRQTVRFYVDWIYPAVKTTSSAAKATYRRYYTLRFQHPDQVIELARKAANGWSAAIDQWHAAYNVPPAFKRIWFAGLCSVSTSTILTTEPYFFEQEVPHGWVNTMDVSVYHNWLYLELPDQVALGGHPVEEWQHPDHG